MNDESETIRFYQNRFFRAMLKSRAIKNLEVTSLSLISSFCLLQKKVTYIIVAVPTIINYKLESTDTSITLSFNRINGVDSFNVTIAPSKGSYHYVVDEEKDMVKKTIDGLQPNTSYAVTLEMVSVNHYGKPLPPISEISVVRTKSQ